MNIPTECEFITSICTKVLEDSKKYSESNSISYAHAFGALSGTLMGILVRLNLSDEQLKTLEKITGEPV